MLDRWPHISCVHITFGLLLTSCFVSTSTNSMKCLVNWIPPGPRVRLRNTQPYLPVFSGAGYFLRGGWIWREGGSGGGMNLVCKGRLISSFTHPVAMNCCFSLALSPIHSLPVNIVDDWARVCACDASMDLWRLNGQCPPCACCSRVLWFSSQHYCVSRWQVLQHCVLQHFFTGWTFGLAGTWRPEVELARVASPCEFAWLRRNCKHLAAICHFALKRYLLYGPLRVGANFHGQFSLLKSRVLGWLVYVFFCVLPPHS